MELAKMTVPDHDTSRVTRRGTNWGRVSTAVLRDSGLSLQAKAVYAVLATYADDADRSCFPRQAVLADHLGISVDTLQRHIKALEDAGVLEVVPKFRPDGGRGANDYVLTDDLGAAKSQDPPLTDAVPPSRTDAVTREHDQLEHDQRTKPTPPSPSLLPDLALVPTEAFRSTDAEFELWWKLWPKKRDKGHARKAYARATRQTPVSVLYEALLVQLGALRQAEARGGFCPLPATWLNGERWLDDVDAMTPPPVQAHLSPLTLMVQESIAAGRLDHLMNEPQRGIGS